ncbi:acyl-CoA thioesterase [bacterium]|nr:MAG: acyl-CoA thioesterase [bacterium]
MIPTVERVRVRYGETDMMGHAYYANYLYWFEQARGAWCRARGYSYLVLEEMGYRLPAVEAHLEYKREALYDDVLAVKVWISEIKRASMRFDYEVTNERTGQLATTGYTWHVLMSGETRKAVSIPPEVREMLEREPTPESGRQE